MSAMEQYLNAYLDALKLEFTKYASALKKLPEIDWKTFLTTENLLTVKEKFLADTQKTVDGVVWNDRFIMVLITIHVLFIIQIIQDRKSYFKQIFYVIFLSLLSFSSSFLNKLGSDNWNKFAARNYFDKKGSFMLLFLNIPVLIELILCLLIISCLSLCYLCTGKSKGKKSKSKASTKAKANPKKAASKDQSAKGNAKKSINRKKFN
ncbi:hypothetical protein BCR32DRAFT_268757 [Anaeromyces robustus]|uniref:Uncharacterized protein n=1 Tax=Anaeromyces robustus TaxID=1754192 RepID=A0A1Y1X4I4_9FUNG|nr:hypothetical protein BCR32DRAFT_268757 [Anaeromyces robustus]|eukprot:ORX80612.1 hypothetical protein BCR32DRAFT_268757 [Anaeromyces robustus]